MSAAPTPSQIATWWTVVAALSASVMDGSAQTCFPNLEGRTSEMNYECCDEPEEDCSSGRPSTCNAGCAQLLLPFFSDCGSLLGKAAGDYEDVVALCHQALPDWTRGQQPKQPSAAIDCAGAWSPCTEACETAAERTWHETAAQVGSRVWLHLEGLLIVEDQLYFAAP